MRADTERPVLAVDIGGTKILAALVSSGGAVIARERCLTEAVRGPQSVTGRVLQIIETLLTSAGVAPADLSSICVAAAGVVDVSRGVVSMSPSLPGWNEVPLKAEVEARFGIRTLVVNDASAAAVGEHRFGAGKGARNLVFVTVSTGIGGGIIIEDEPYAGPSGSAGEIGHMVIDINGRPCNCGGVGCLETLASGAALAADARGRVEAGEASALVGRASGDPAGITAELVGLAASQGDGLTLEAGRRAGHLVNILNPEVIVVGGGLSQMGDLLLGPAREAVHEMAFRLPARAVRIVKAQLGEDAGVVGAGVIGAAAAAYDRQP
jgi:glucokinase